MWEGGEDRGGARLTIVYECTSTPGSLCRQQCRFSVFLNPAPFFSSNNALCREGAEAKELTQSPLAFNQQILLSMDEITVLPENRTLEQGAQNTFLTEIRDSFSLSVQGQSI